MVLTGQNFAPGAAVTFGGKAATQVTVNSTTQITVTLPALLGTQGLVSVVVTNPDGKSVARGDLFAYYLSQIVFASPMATNVGSGVRPMAAADFNGDGKLDLALGDNSAGAVVLLGDGTGSFPTVKMYPAGMNPTGITVADLNADMKLDFVIANATANVSVFLGDGTGSFAAAKNFPAGSQPVSVAAADFNGDGKQDLVVANQMGNNVSILTGDGAGNFSGPSNVAVGMTPQWVSVGDFNKDNKQDIAVANNSASNIVSILLGNGMGGFTSKPIPSFASVGLAVADFSGDGNLDVATNNTQAFLGDGMGGFGAANSWGGGVYWVATGDLNGDGRLDLVGSQTTNNVYVSFGDGTGKFPNLSMIAANAPQYAVAVGDFNNDKKADIAVTNSVGASGIRILLNQSQ